MKSAALCLGLVLSGFSSLMAQSSPPPAPPSPPPEARQFDFWIGDWEVFAPNGKKVGENRIEKMANGFGLLENWTGAGGGTGKSLNSWHADKKRWQQYWVGLGGPLEISGGIENGAMVMTGEGTAPNGGKLRNRITWTPNADGTVRQLWESTKDGGQTWTVAFDGLYRRK
jgi:hypothetical protein